MSVFNVQGLKSINESTLDDVVGTPEKYAGCSITNSYKAIAESEENFSSLMKAVGIQELTYFSENGTEMVYEAGAIMGFFTKLRDFFKSIWKKIVSIYESFIGWMDSLIMKDKDFVKKYKSLLQGKVLTDLEVKTFEYTTSAIKFDTAAAKNIVDSKIPDAMTKPGDASHQSAQEALAIEVDKTDEKDKILGSIRGIFAGKPVDEGDFAETCEEKLRNGSSEADDVKITDITKYLNKIEGYADAKKVAENLLKNFKKTIDDIVKNLQTEEKNLDNAAGKSDATAETKSANGAAVKVVSRKYNLMKDMLSICTQANGYILAALKEERTAARAVCARAISYTYKQESASVQQESGLFANVVFK